MAAKCVGVPLGGGGALVAGGAEGARPRGRGGWPRNVWECRWVAGGGWGPGGRRGPCRVDAAEGREMGGSAAGWRRGARGRRGGGGPAEWTRRMAAKCVGVPLGGGGALVAGGAEGARPSGHGGRPRNVWECRWVA